MENQSIENHQWPKDQSACKFGPWKPYARGKLYRMCVSRECGAYEVKDA
jgi:hypothetical protein